MTFAANTEGVARGRPKIDQNEGRQHCEPPPLISVRRLSICSRHFLRTALVGTLFRSATSAGANYDEARRAQSRRDFAHKVSIAAKEMGEAAYGLGLVDRSHLVPEHFVNRILTEANELVAILTSSARTASASQSRPNSTSPVQAPRCTSQCRLPIRRRKRIMSRYPRMETGSRGQGAGNRSELEPRGTSRLLKN